MCTYSHGTQNNKRFCSLAAWQPETLSLSLICVQQMASGASAHQHKAHWPMRFIVVLKKLKSLAWRTWEVDEVMLGCFVKQQHMQQPQQPKQLQQQLKHSNSHDNPTTLTLTARVGAFPVSACADTLWTWATHLHLACMYCVVEGLVGISEGVVWGWRPGGSGTRQQQQCLHCLFVIVLLHKCKT